MSNRPETEKPLLGRFWLPGSTEETSRPGLMILGKEGASLQLEGAFSASPVLQDAVIFGRLTSGHVAVSLFNCFGGVTYREREAAESHITSTWVVFGCLTENLEGNGIEFRLAGSETWFHEQTFSVELGSEDNQVTVRFRGYEEWRYRINESLTLVRAYRSTVPVGMWGTERFEATRGLVYRILSQSPVDYDQLWHLMIRFRRLIAFLSRFALEQSDIGILGTDESAEYPPVFPVHHSSFYPIAKDKFDWDNQLIRYDEVKDRFEELIARWFSIYEALPEPFERYFAAFERGRSDAALHFLWVVAAVEELHKARTKRKGLFLLDRLKDLCERWRNAMEPVPPEDILVEIKDTRHYFAHGASDLRTSAAHDWRLLRYTEFLIGIFQLEVLSLLGFDDDYVVAVARGRYWMREAFALRTFPD